MTLPTTLTRSRSRGRLTIGSPHLLLSPLEVVHAIENLLRDCLQLPHLRLETRERLLIRNGIVVDCVRSNVDVEVNGGARFAVA